MRYKTLGERRTSVDIQARTTAADSLAYMKPTWSTVATVWCLKRQLTGRELLNASQQKLVADFVLETWYDPDVAVTTLNRVVIGSTIYGISRVDNVDDLNDTWHLFVTQTALAEES